MAWTNIVAVPGLVYTLRYFNAASEVASTAAPLVRVGGVFSLSGPQAEWDRAVIEVTNFGAALLPINARISVVGAHVAPPYGGVIAIASGTTFGSTVAQQTFPSGTPFTGSKSGVATVSHRFFIAGHNTGSGADWISLSSLVIELDGTFVPPDFWRDYDGTTEPDSGVLRKMPGNIIVPEVRGQPYIPPSQTCAPAGTPPGPMPPGGSNPGGSPPVGGSGGEPPPGEPGGGAPPAYPYCWNTSVNGRQYRCCRSGPSDPGQCTPL